MVLSDTQRQQVLQTSQLLIENQEYELALNMLQPVDCILATWLKGKIYLSFAEQIATSFTFKYYSTEKQNKEYRDVLACAYEHLYKAGCMMPSASLDIREKLNPYLWSEIGKVENELARTRPRVETNDNECDIDDDFQDNEKHRVESMIEHLAYWSL